MKRLDAALVLLAILVAQPLLAQDQFPVRGKLPSFEVKDGDRVVFLGSEFTEQAIKHNYFEAEVTARWPDRRVKFFNMGWSGDTPAGIARGYFGGEAEGFKRLSAELDRIKPTLVFICYGSNIEGKTTEKFSRDFRKLYEKIKQHTTRTVILTPPPVESRPSPQPRAEFINNPRRAATRFLKYFYVSESEDSFFVNLFASLEKRLRSPNRPLTTDSLRFTTEGYKAISDLTLRLLRVPGTPARTDLSQEKFEQLRELIADKNQLYFHRYRPQTKHTSAGSANTNRGRTRKRSPSSMR